MPVEVKSPLCVVQCRAGNEMVKAFQLQVIDHENLQPHVEVSHHCAIFPALRIHEAEMAIPPFGEKSRMSPFITRESNLGFVFLWHDEQFKRASWLCQAFGRGR